MFAAGGRGTPVLSTFLLSSHVVLRKLRPASYTPCSLPRSNQPRKGKPLPTTHNPSVYHCCKPGTRSGLFQVQQAHRNELRANYPILTLLPGRLISTVVGRLRLTLGALPGNVRDGECAIVSAPASSAGAALSVGGPSPPPRVPAPPNKSCCCDLVWKPSATLALVR